MLHSPLRFRRFLLLVSIVALLATACGSSDDVDNEDSPDVGTQVDAGTVGDAGPAEPEPDADAGPAEPDATGEDSDTESGCTAEETDCGDSCVDLDSDDDHCGECGNACGVGESCVDAQCQSGDVSFSEDVEPILDGCITCHGGVTPRADLNLSDDAYDSLVDVESTDCPGRIRVVPGEPDESYLIDKLEGADDICGTQMPQSGELPASELDTIRQWISEGALDN